MHDSEPHNDAHSGLGDTSHSTVIPQSEADIALSASPSDRLTRVTGEDEEDGACDKVETASKGSRIQAKSIWRRGWKVPAGIVGFYLLGMCYVLVAD